MAAGVAFALVAGLMWGLVFVAPLLLPAYSAPVLAVGRYLAFGLIALPLVWFDRHALAALKRVDWLEAARLSAVGNFLYYVLLAAAIQSSGGPLPTMIIGTLPVVIAISSNLRDAQRDGRVPWLRMAPSLALIAIGIALVNHAELQRLRFDPAADIERYALGALLAVGAMVCWTWYPLRNADWLRAHADRSPRTWATAQGVVTLPLAVVGALVLLSFGAVDGAAPLGADPPRFLLLMMTIGLFSSWLGTLCWNEASQRLPTTLSGQLIVFETLAALAYVYAHRGAWPPPMVLAGIVALVAGVMWALRVRPEPIRAAP